MAAAHVDTASARASIARDWTEAPYYELAEKDIHVFWGPGSRFARLFPLLDLTAVVELACGRGRLCRCSGRLNWRCS